MISLLDNDDGVKMLDVYLARDTTTFVMHYVYGVRGSSLLPEFTDYLHHFHSNLLHHYD